MQDEFNYLGRLYLCVIIIAVQRELIERLKKEVKEWEDWKATSKERHAKGKAKADLAIAKNKNTLSIKTTRKRKK